MWNDLPLILAQQDTTPPEVPSEAAPPPVLGEPAPSDDAIEAQEGADGNGLAGKTAKKDDPPPTTFPWIFILLAMVLLWVVLMGGGRKEKKKRAAMLATMGKGDKVQSIGGILGTVIDIKDNEVVVKVDENANIRLRFAKSAIQSIIESQDEGGDS